MSTVRLNVTLPKDLVHLIDTQVAPRQRSHFIALSINNYLEKLEREKMEQELRAGYSASLAEDNEMVSDFKSLDLEGWDED